MYNWENYNVIPSQLWRNHLEIREMNGFVHVLGCGDAFSAGGRNHTGFLVKYRKEMLLLDCGATTLPALLRAGYDPAELSGVIITHFHGDHYGGLPNLILNAMHGSGKQKPLTIFSPPGGREKVSILMEAMYPGTASLLDKLPVTFFYYDGTEIEMDNYSVLGLPVAHTPETIPHGIRVSFGDKVIAFSGDTSWVQNLVTLSGDTDICILECNFLSGEPKGHLSYETIKKHLTEIKSARIVLTHMGNEVIISEGLDLERLNDDAKIEL